MTQKLSGVSSRQQSLAVMAVFIVVVLLVFWRPLTGQGVYLGTDLLQPLPPWNANTHPDFVPHNWIVGDTLDGHVDKVAFYSALRDGELDTWHSEISAGVPSLPETLSPFDLAYLVFPDWYAPGFAAALKLFAAMALSYGFLLSLRTAHWAAAVGGIAYGLSGFFAAWTGWPHTAVSVLIPGLFWAAERLWQKPTWQRLVPVALAVTAMVLGNFPAVLLYALLALAGYYVVRWIVDREEIGISDALRRAGLAAGGIAAGVLGAGIYLVPFLTNLSVLDLTYREQLPGAHLPARFLLTLASPLAFGSHHGDVTWWAGEQNWPEAVTYAGSSVLILALFAFALPTKSPDGPRRGIAVGLAAIVVATSLAVFGGGVFTRAAQLIPLMDSNFIGRMRVIINFGLAMLAGLGAHSIHVMLSTQSLEARARMKAATLWGLGATALVAVLFSPLLVGYLRDITDLGLRRQTFSATAVPILAGVSMVFVIAWLFTRTGPSRWVPLFVGGIVTLELATAFVPVHAVTNRADYYPVTPGHEFLTAELRPGERYAGAEWAFYPNTSLVYGHADARGHAFHVPGYRALLESVDPNAFAGGTPTNAFLSTAAALDAPALDLIGVRFWAEDIRLPVRGEVLGIAEPTIGAGSTSQRSRGFVAPDGGIRAVRIHLAVAPEDLDEVVTVELTDASGGLVATSERTLWDAPVGGWLTFPLVAETVVPGSMVTATLGGATEAVELSAGGDGGLALALVTGQDDGLELRFADGVVIYERTMARSIASYYPAGTVVDDSTALSMITAGGPRTVALLGEPMSVPGGAADTGLANVVEVSDDRYSITVSSEAPGIVVLAVAAHPDWSATVDGESTQIVPADLAFQAVAVPAGEHVVEFRFTAKSATRGLWLTLATLAALLVTWLRGSPSGEIKPTDQV